MITLEDVKKNPEVQELVIGAQKQLDVWNQINKIEQNFKEQ